MNAYYGSVRNEIRSGKLRAYRFRGAYCIHTDDLTAYVESCQVETTPPLYFVLIWLWAKVFGTGEVALRAISTLAGIALVPIAYMSARELVSVSELAMARRKASSTGWLSARLCRASCSVHRKRDRI